jgi:predicted RNA-binding protein with PUA-like domain
MAFWLLKTEPSEYSWADLVNDKKTTWSGIANPTALIHLRTIANGDSAIIYHTGNEKQCVGIAEVVRGAYPDPDEENAKLVVVDLKPREQLKQPVTLGQIKADPAFEGFDLLRISRLSVVPVPPAMWKRLMTLAKMK